MTTPRPLIDDPQTEAALWLYLSRAADQMVEDVGARRRLPPGTNYEADLHVLGKCNGDMVAVTLPGVLASTPYELPARENALALKALAYVLGAIGKEWRDEILPRVRRALIAGEPRLTDITLADLEEWLHTTQECLAEKPRYSHRVQFSVAPSPYALV